MILELSSRVQAIKPSPTLAVTARAAQLKAEGKNIIGLGAGEPDFDTPEHIKQAAIKAIHQGATRYTPVGGTPVLKQAIIDKFKRDNQLEYNAKQILVSCGGKQSFFNLAQAIINPGDEVVIPAPYWVSYPDMVLIASGKPIIVEAGIEQGFKLTAEQLAAAITPKTRMVVLNSPSNPCGAVYTLQELKALGDVLKQHPEIIIATDDMYEHIALTDEPFVNIVNACPELYARTMVLNGVSKAYAMTGWRIGYAGGPEKIIKAMEKVQSQSTSNPCAVSQAAAVEALNGSQECIKPMVAAFKQRHEFVVNALNQIPGVQCLPAGGAFYAFPNMSQAIQKLQQNGTIHAATDVALSEYLLDKAGVAVVPGSAFGCEGYVRLSFATSLEILQDALQRIQKALAT